MGKGSSLLLGVIIAPNESTGLVKKRFCLKTDDPIDDSLSSINWAIPDAKDPGKLPEISSLRCTNTCRYCSRQRGSEIRDTY